MGSRWDSLMLTIRSVPGWLWVLVGLGIVFVKAALFVGMSRVV